MTKRFAAVFAAALLASCGGGNPLSNPDSVQNPPGEGGQKLSFRYFQKCINVIYDTPLPVNQGGVISTNTCGSGGCHDTNTGTGGALRVVQQANEVDLTAVTADEARATDMYKNYYSSQGATVIGSPPESRLLAKPLLTVLHGGGQIFANADDDNARRIAYWIGRPMPEGQDEFSVASDTMFDSATGECKNQ